MVKDYKQMSQFDPGQVLKMAHDDRAKALKVLDANSQVPGGFTKVVLETNGLGSVTEATFYAGTIAEKSRIKFTGDSGGSLNSKYFLLSAGEDSHKFYVWYNVDGAGVDPLVANRCGIEVHLTSNDPASIVALATKLTLQSYEHFYIEPNGSDVLLVNCTKMGMTSPTVDVNTGFFITQSTEGATEKIKCINLPVETDFLYKFNFGENKFELIYTGGSSSAAAIPGTPAIQLITAAAANTEYSFVLPSGTKKYEFNLRGDAKLIYSFTSGFTTVYKTVFPGNQERWEGILPLSALTIYFKVTKANQELELLTWI